MVRLAWQYQGLEEMKRLAAIGVTTFASMFHRCVVRMPLIDENDIPNENGSTKPPEWEPKDRCLICRTKAA
jgi:hypothetical protein